ncbi:hypothetical protein SDC9_194612 [bioreactor metagenome]|uniref:Uncharacterized protein n=1 Tax=bioreactor metagenome TaxID=1076179 RepID=A0A645I894_9ZZZZ
MIDEFNPPQIEVFGDPAIGGVGIKQIAPLHLLADAEITQIRRRLPGGAVAFPQRFRHEKCPAQQTRDHEKIKFDPALMVGNMRQPVNVAGIRPPVRQAEVMRVAQIIVAIHPSVPSG